MKEKIAENISNIDRQAKPDVKKRLNQVVSVALALVVSLGVIGVSPRIALADQPEGNVPTFLCTDPSGENPPIFVHGGRQVATYRQGGFVCVPADIP